MDDAVREDDEFTATTALEVGEIVESITTVEEKV